MARLSAAIAGWKRDDLGHAFDAVGVPAGPVNHVDEVFADPHVIARGMRRAYARLSTRRSSPSAASATP